MPTAQLHPIPGRNILPGNCTLEAGQIWPRAEVTFVEVEFGIKC